MGTSLGNLRVHRRINQSQFWSSGWKPDLDLLAERVHGGVRRQRTGNASVGRKDPQVPQEGADPQEPGGHPRRQQDGPGSKPGGLDRMWV